MRVTLCAATYNRPDGLGRLLAAVAALQLQEPVNLSVAVVIVDNSPDRNARAVVEAAATDFPWPLHYVSESRRGITFARNAALQKAAELSSDAVVFIDDDEYPDAGWLEALLRRQRISGAAVVLGAVRPVFPDGTPGWIISGRFFETHRFEDGAELDDAHTANVLIDLSSLHRHGLVFDNRYALTGGEDTMLFQALLDAGERIVYAADAVVFETVPQSRANLEWLMKRWYRTGNIEAALFLRGHEGSSWRPLGNCLRGLLRIAAGGGLFLASLLVLGLGRRERIVRPLYTVCRGVGILASTLGRNYSEYREIHGT
ncbi:glycosyltransferase [Pelagibius litoralis]|uniref:Glycosyltransferase n=1 Tax=Pelagibius litoralis TaxID=374515 RepID=A0A967EVC3_9PROT|nr:glycosyltransferase [Pelagibius litoralis]NIA67639.1 glycosyltransferase [Pelagibius litoralis]